MSEKRIGTLIYDPSMGRFDIRFGIESYYGGLHCGECFDVKVKDAWIPVRIEMDEEWISNSYFDEDTRAELESIKEDENEIKERFYMDLEFGTAGLRGIIGAGTNRMNIYTVRKATQGLANYIMKNDGQGKGVAIAYDSRHMSTEFAKEAACCLAANGIKAYIFESLRPTPELSYAVRKLGCIAGINITASHNPPSLSPIW